MKTDEETTEERCHLIVRQFMYGNFSEHLTEQFHAWLVDGRHRREKDAALRRIFDEIMDSYDDGCNPQKDHSKRHIHFKTSV